MDDHESKEQRTLHEDEVPPQTLWSKLTRRIRKSSLPNEDLRSRWSRSLSCYLREKRSQYDNTPFRSIINSYFRERKKEVVLSTTYEIKRRMHELPGYKAYLQTLWENFTHRIPELSSYLPRLSNNSRPFCSVSFSFSSYFHGHLRKKENKKKNNNRALPTSEITRSMSGIPVYKISDYSLTTLNWLSKDDRGGIELCCMSKPDAEDLLLEAKDDGWKLVFDYPLAHVVKEEEAYTPIRLVPELKQIKNAIELKNKDVRDKDMVDLSFTGVPVFQSDRLVLTDESTGKTYALAFFRKEDLDKHIDEVVEKNGDINIKVLAFEDIIKNMKDNSTSESNEVLFVGPGITSWTWHYYRL